MNVHVRVRGHSAWPVGWATDAVAFGSAVKVRDCPSDVWRAAPARIVAKTMLAKSWPPYRATAPYQPLSVLGNGRPAYDASSAAPPRMFAASLVLSVSGATPISAAAVDRVDNRVAPSPFGVAGRSIRAIGP